MFVNFGRDIDFSAVLCYNGTNEKPLPLGTCIFSGMGDKTQVLKGEDNNAVFQVL